MGNNSEIRAFYRRLQEIEADSCLHFLEEQKSGLTGLLCFLYENKEAVTAGEISRHLRVSSARTAVLLKKCQEKDLIAIRKDPDDQRKSVIVLSEKGRETAEKIKQKANRLLADMMEKIGAKRMSAFLDTLEDMKKVVETSLAKEETCWN